MIELETLESSISEVSLASAFRVDALDTVLLRKRIASRGKTVLVFYGSDYRN